MFCWYKWIFFIHLLHIVIRVGSQLYFSVFPMDDRLYVVTKGHFVHLILIIQTPPNPSSFHAVRK